MSVSLYAQAILPANDEYKAKAQAYRACEIAGIPIPQQLVDFFGDSPPDDDGTVFPLFANHLGGHVAQKHECAVRWTDGEMLDGIQIDVTKLPSGTRYVRFYGAW